MFTGIIESIGRIREKICDGSNIHWHIQADFASELTLGESVSIDGACHTVVSFDKESFEVISIKETLTKTNFESKQPGDSVNLERSMLANGRFSGHMVQGHIDTTALCMQIDNKLNSYTIYFEFNKEISPFLIQKGSICINGISLTISNLSPDHFEVSIIPHTWEHTNLQYLQVGEKVNIETDIMARYLWKWREGGGISRGI